MPVPLEIKKYPDRLLSEPCSPMSSSDIWTPEIQNLIYAMIDYVGQRRDKIWGLAANEVGYPYKIAVLDLGNRLQEIINPEYVYLSKKTSLEFEGCLSFPRFFGFPVRRSEGAAAEGVDRFNRPILLAASGWRSYWLQHEVDHLYGITIINWRKRENFLKENLGSRLESPVAA